MKMNNGIYVSTIIVFQGSLYSSSKAMFQMCVFFFVLHSVVAREGIVSTLVGGGLPHVGHVDTCVDGPASVDGTKATAR